MKITATKTATGRTVTVEHNGQTETYTFGLVKTKAGAWELPDPATVDREVKAYIAALDPASAPVEDTELAAAPYIAGKIAESALAEAVKESEGA